MAKKQRKEQREPSESEQAPPEESYFPIIGIGASAGGLEALKNFFSAVKPKSGIAYIVIIHMSPQQPSVLPELLQRVCSIPVAFIEDGEELAPDKVYVAPPSQEIDLRHGTAHLLEIDHTRVVLPIDFFFRSLARERKDKAAAIILSGTGTDGSLGIKEIKHNDGLVLIQTIDSAQYNGMPRSAQNTKLVDKALSPEEMPALLREYFAKTPCSFREEDKEERDWLNKIFAILVARVGHDFSSYKRNTILRRIYRRMGMNQIEDHEQYLHFLRENPEEVQKLFQELLIGVTRFFRDPESFEVLKQQVLPNLIAPLDENAELRVWIPGCSTGEEAYSLALILHEYLEENPKRLRLQIFATDIDQEAIRKAREGLFPPGIAADVDAGRLNRFFVQEGDYYRIRKDIRDRIIFSLQNVAKDPPFLRINLLICRNLLIYLNADMQKKLMPLFHYAIHPGGVLMLGSSESLGTFTSLFQPLNNKWKIFKRKDVPQSVRGMIEFPTGVPRQQQAAEKSEEIHKPRRAELAELMKRAVLELAAPVSILVDRDGNILYIHGRAGKYIESTSGPPTHNILDMAKEGLRIELSSALRRACDTNSVVERKRILLNNNGSSSTINLRIFPLYESHSLEGFLLIVFEELENQKVAADEFSRPVTQRDVGLEDRIRELEKELQDTRESHQTTVEELESANEELKSTNEELQSSNEELQSTNEELESSKEELQSLNEELQTVNSELQSKVEELSAAHDDMNNLLNGTDIATVFVDNHIRIKRFTKGIKAIIKLIQSDIGRPLADIGTHLKESNLSANINEVLDTLIPKELEVQSEDDVWYLMRILPYRTSDNRIDGAVLTFLNIDVQKRAQHSLQRLNDEKEQERKLMRKVFDMNRDPLAVLNAKGELIVANSSFTSLMKIGTDEVEATDIFSLENQVLRSTDLKAQLKQALETGEDFKSDSFSIESDSMQQLYTIQGQIMQTAQGQPYRILLYFLRSESHGGNQE